MSVKIEHYETMLFVDGDYIPCQLEGDGSMSRESFDVTEVTTKSGDDITALLDGISDRYAAFLPEHQHRAVGLWGAIADKALAAAKSTLDDQELESVMTADIGYLADQEHDRRRDDKMVSP